MTCTTIGPEHPDFTDIGIIDASGRPMHMPAYGDVEAVRNGAYPNAVRDACRHATSHVRRGADHWCQICGLDLPEHEGHLAGQPT